MNVERAIKMFEVCQSVAKRVVPDADLASEFALSTFENFFKVERTHCDDNYLRAFAWKSIGGLYANHRKRERRMLRESSAPEEEQAAAYFEALLPRSPARQENFVDAKRWLGRVGQLDDPHRSVLLCMADGGSALDVARDMKVDPRGALQMIASARKMLHAA